MNILKYLALFFLISLIFGLDLEDGQLDVSTDNAKSCESYRQLARAPNPLSNRGNKCCEFLGCFSNEKNTPWEHLSEEPSCLSKITPQFYLYSFQNNDPSSFVKFDYFTLNSTINNGSIKIQKSQPFFTVIHGFNTKWPCDWMIAIKNELLLLKNNVLLVDWTSGSNVKDYVQAAANTRVVGKALADVIQQFVNHNYVDLNSATIVGFSLGAHTAGYAGSELKSLNRIIALDPAGPLFVCESTKARLDPTDAHLVQAIHTNGESFSSGGLGTMQKLGHVDFYANGGREQPGCDNSVSILNSFISFNFAKVGSQVSCSHARCPWLFVDILKQAREQAGNICKFSALPCDDADAWTNGDCFTCSKGQCPLPGYNLKADSGLTGKFFFNTLAENATGSFCGKQLLLKLETDKEVKGSIKVSFYGSNNEELPSILIQKSDDSLAETKSIVIVAPWEVQFDNIKKIQFLYSKYESIFKKDGPRKFALNHVSLLNSNGDKLALCSPLDINSDNAIDIDLQKSC